MIAQRLLLVFSVCLSSPLYAQGTAPFELLSVPGNGFGTCMPALTRDSTKRGSRLVIKSREPANSREIMVLVDPQSRSMAYSDRVSLTRDSVSGTGEFVIATFDSAGRLVVGFRTQSVVEYPFVPRDLAAFRVMRDSMKGSSTSKSLNPEEQRKVATMVTFLRQRCPS